MSVTQHHSKRRHSEAGHSVVAESSKLRTRPIHHGGRATTSRVQVFNYDAISGVYVYVCVCMYTCVKVIYVC